MKAELIPITLCLPEGAPRTEGIHVSRVIAKIAGEAGILKPEYVEDLQLVEVSGAGQAWWDRLSDANKLRISLGLAWEEWYAKVLAQTMGVDFHPGEIQADGVYMTPDGEAIDFIICERGLTKAALAMHEIKLTYKSVKTVGDLSTQWIWLAQTKSYAKAKNTRVVFVHVFFACGDYKYPITPQLKCWRIEYTQAELDDNWQLIMDYIKHQQFLERPRDEGLESGV